jgi:hypothetical protein
VPSIYVVTLGLILSTSIWTTVGCATQSISAEAAAISVGDDKKVVLKEMGPPENRQMQGKLEAWQYCSTGFSKDEYLIVWMADGKVTGMTTYTAVNMASCSGGFREVRWEDAPTISVEVRNR